jgi:hypothetical protein
LVKACQGYELVVIDPAISAHSAIDMNDMGAVRSTMEPFRVLARESNAVVVVTAHSPKVQADPGDSLAGSHQLAAVVDGLIHLRRSPQLQKHERELHFVGRDWPEIEPQVVALDPATLTWRPQGALSDVRDAAKDAQRQQDAATVLDTLPATGDGLTYVDIQAFTRISENRVRDALTSLAAAGRVERVVSPSRRAPVRFRTVEGSSSSQLLYKGQDDNENAGPGDGVEPGA